MKKTALEWFEQLPQPIRTQAIENSNGLIKTYSSLPECLGGNFTWIDSPQGHKYWKDIRARAEAGEFYQPTPNLHGWIPVRERLPERLKDANEWDVASGRSEMVMVISPLFKYPQNAQYLHELSEWQTEHHGNRFSNATFWQPMPKLPEVQNV